MIDPVELYDEVRQALCAAVAQLSQEEVARTIPATPAWDAHDVLAHLTGNTADIAAGRWPRFDATAVADDPDQLAMVDAMTARQVTQRRGRSVAQLAEEWSQAWRIVAPVLRGDQPVEGLSPRALPVLAAVLLSDVTTHAFDVLGAHGRSALLRESPAVAVVFASFAFGVDARIRRRGLTPLLVQYDGGKQRLLGGEGEPGATLSGSRFELMRAFAGRRSAGQIRALAWEGDVESYADLLPAYGVRHEDLIE